MSVRLPQLGAVVGLVLAACGAATSASPSPSPTATADIKRTRIDIAYSDLLDNDVHNVSSKKALLAAIDALVAEAKSTGGSTEFPALQLDDRSEPVLADFKKFADAAGLFAARNRQLSAARIADAAISGMIGASPDCHTYYVNASGKAFQSREARTTGTPAQVPASGTSLGSPDRAGLTGKMLADGIAYITWREFVTEGTYKIADALRAMLDKAVSMGATAWLFDLRGNSGGIGPTDAMASWFLNGGEPMLTTLFRNGNGGTSTAKGELRLPDAYQLPVAIILNDRGGSGPEIFAAALKENKRATIVGQRSTGCLGGFYNAQFPDGGFIAVAAQEFVGGVTGTKYNNVGVEPDVPAGDGAAVDRAIEVLKVKIRP